ncbi:Amiloride-sensitive sodium channel [Ancylostoma ceylanicum]|nr:Amiloride-sensitive sodium channel [Ancylostoma ceylanicum]
MKLCSFGGRQFDCCKYIQPQMTNMGNCHSLDMRGARDWMQKQTVAGVNAGLQIILDAHMEEQFDGTGDDAEPIFTNAFENGFRYYVHAPDTIPYLVSEGISVSPGTRVYSAISTNTYVLLPPENWGNCSDAWPPSYSTTLPYSSVNCNSLCNARFFYDRCGCSPFTYNIDVSFPMCTPYQSFQCIDQHVRTQVNGSEYFNTPQCQECKVECNSLAYHAYNSYGHGFSHGALKWLNRKNPEWSKAHMRSNFLTLNVFFRDMAHTEYRQIQATSLTEILSDIGGNMGMFLGMSLITVTELSLFISKIGWIAFSKRRRDYLYNKKKREQEREKQLEETMSTFSMLRTRKNAAGISDSVRVTQSRLRSLSKQIRDSFRKSSKPQGTTAPTPALEKVEAGTCTDLPEKMLEEQRKQFDDIVQNKALYMDRTLSNPESMIELQIDLRDLKRKIASGFPVSIKRRRRASTAPPAPRGVKVAPMLANYSAKLSACVPFYTANSKDLRLHRDSM